jgi:hypothetical protein
MGRYPRRLDGMRVVSEEEIELSIGTSFSTSISYGRLKIVSPKYLALTEQLLHG